MFAIFPGITEFVLEIHCSQVELIDMNNKQKYFMYVKRMLRKK